MSPKRKKQKKKTTSTSKPKAPKIPTEYKLIAKAMGVKPEDYINLPQLVAQQQQQIDLLATKMGEIYEYFEALKAQLAQQGNPPPAPASQLPLSPKDIPSEPTEGPPAAPGWLQDLFSGKEGKELVKELIKSFAGPAVDEGTLKLAKAIQTHLTKAATAYAKRLMSEIGKEGFMEKLE